jgi:AbiV family abortive infection protein
MKKLSIEQIDSGIHKIFENSKSLITEAIILRDAGFFARAFTLAHLAREEMAKISMLYAASLYLLIGVPVDWNQLNKRLRNHISKLTNDAIGTFINTEIPKDVDRKAYLEKLLSGVRGRNSWKNNSLYVGFDGYDFTSPLKLIKEQAAARTIDLAVMTLRDNELILRVFSKLLTNNTAEFREELLQFSDIKKLDINELSRMLLSLNELMSEAKQNLKATEVVLTEGGGKGVEEEKGAPLKEEFLK